MIEAALKRRILQTGKTEKMCAINTVQDEHRCITSYQRRFSFANIRTKNNSSERKREKMEMSGYDQSNFEVSEHLRANYVCISSFPRTP